MGIIWGIIILISMFICFIYRSKNEPCQDKAAFFVGYKKLIFFVFDNWLFVSLFDHFFLYFFITCSGIEYPPQSFVRTQLWILFGRSCPIRKNCGLLQSCLRDEWKFAGLVMTDWFSTQELDMLKAGHETIYPAASSIGCIFAGNDLQMPGCSENVQDIRFWYIIPPSW